MLRHRHHYDRDQLETILEALPESTGRNATTLLAVARAAKIAVEARHQEELGQDTLEDVMADLDRLQKAVDRLGPRAQHLLAGAGCGNLSMGIAKARMSASKLPRIKMGAPANTAALGFVLALCRIWERHTGQRLGRRYGAEWAAPFYNFVMAAMPVEVKDDEATGITKTALKIHHDGPPPAEESTKGQIIISIDTMGDVSSHFAKAPRKRRN